MEKKPNFISLELHAGNFVQFYFNREPYIRFSIKQDDGHRNLLARVLDEFEIKGFEDLVGRPKLKSEDYEAVGMGQFSRVGNDILLKGRSVGYEITPNKKHLEDLFSYLPPEIKIEIS